MAKNQITGGAFQDCAGNPAALATLSIKLNQDSHIASGGQLAAGSTLKVPLDGNGNVSGTVSIWPTDQLSPAGAQYIFSVVTATGQPIYGPQAFSIPSAPSPFDLGTLVPTY